MIEQASAVGARDNAVDVSVPLGTAHAATLRVVVMSLAVDAGFSIDEIDDVKLAVSEVFTSLIGDDPDDASGRAIVTVSADPGSIEVSLGVEGGGVDVELDPLAATILTSVVDDHRVEDGHVTLVKHSTENVA